MSVPIPEYAGCPWPMDPACQTAEWNALDAPVRERSLALASSTLHRLTGYRVGNCPVVVRPTHRGSPCAFVPFTVSDLTAFHPGVDLHGRWVNGCGTSNEFCTITLPGPVGAVYEVKADGVVLDPADYRVEGTKIIWQGAGDCPWVIAQDVTLPDTEPDTLSVTYLNAYPVDSLGAYAVGVLAMEYAKACTGGKCRLPSGVTSIARAGVSMEINPGMFPDGFTGIREIDSYIALWNPRGAKQPYASRVFTPGANKMGVTGG